MPLVFLHGANVRREDQADEFDENVIKRDQFFKVHGLRSVIRSPNQLKIFNPYWGNLGAKFAWDFASVPARGGTEHFGVEEESFGANDELSLLLLSDALSVRSVEEEIDPDNVLTAAARRSLQGAVDLLWAGGAGELHAADEAASLAALSVRAADYTRHNPKPPWLRTVSNDREFVDKLSEEISSWRLPAEETGEAETGRIESFGVEDLWSPIAAARERLQQAAQAFSPRALLDYARRKATATVGQLIGDIFTYIHQRGPQAEPGPIVQTAIRELERARDARNENDRYLVAVGHSLGGEILFDTLTYYRPDLEVDLLLTAGSQVGLFAELKLLPGIDRNLPSGETPKVVRPANIHHWLNVYDLSDMLGFSASRVFDGVSDYEFSTGQSLLAAHSSYFTTPSFHERMAVRLREIYP